jgi:hypothetical protein
VCDRGTHSEAGVLLAMPVLDHRMKMEAVGKGNGGRRRLEPGCPWREGGFGSLSDQSRAVAHLYS